MINISKKLVLKYSLIILSVILVTTLGIFLFNTYFNNQVHRVRVTNITSNSATITWVTEKPSNGYVRVSKFSNLSTSVFETIKDKANTDIRGVDKRYTHYVTLTDLNADTEYNFLISDGIKSYTLFDSNQNVEWDDVETAKEFKFSTKSSDTQSLNIPQVSYGKLTLIEDLKGIEYDDIIIFSQAYKTDQSGAMLENTGSELRASLVNQDGGWTINRNGFQYGRRDLTIEYLDQRDMIYIVPESKERFEMSGTFALMGQQDNPLNELQLVATKENEKLVAKSNVLVSKVDAASGFCCQLSYQGRENDYMDYEEGDTCSSCDECFKLGKINNDGQALVKIQQKNVDRKTCEAMKVKNSAGAGDVPPVVTSPETPSTPSNPTPVPADTPSTSTGICCVVKYEGRTNDYYDYEKTGSCAQLFPVNSTKPQGKILSVKEYKGVTREACENKTLQAGSTHTSSTIPTGSVIFPNKVCNTKLDKNKFKVAGIDKADFVSYANQLGGTGNYANDCFEYVACKAREDGINPAFALDIWMHESAASSYTKYPTVEDMGIHCYGGNSKFKPYPCNTTPKKDLKSQVEMFNALPHTMCLTSLTVDLAKWAAGYWTGSTCDMAKGNQYVKDLGVQWSRYGKGADYGWIKDTSKAEKNLNCDGLSTNNPTPVPASTPSNYPINNPSTTTDNTSTSVVNSETKTTANTDIPRDQMPRVCCAVLTQNANSFFTDSERTLNCANSYKIGTGSNPADPIVYVTQVPYSSDADCNGKTYPIICENGFPKPQGQNIVGPSTGSHPKCLMADPNVVSDNVMDIAITENGSKNIFSLISKVFAEDKYVSKVQDSTITFTQDGLYELEIKGNKILNLPVNRNTGYRIFIDKNKTLGYQANADKLLDFSIADVKATRKADVRKVEIKQGINIFSPSFNPKVDGRAMKASELLSYINTEGIKVAYITYFNNGNWVDGLRVDENNKGKYLGVDFEIVGGRGYILTSQVDMTDTKSIVLPGEDMKATSTYEIKKGWNQVVLNNNELKATQFISKLGSNTVTISYWDSTKGMYVVYKIENGKVFGTDFVMKKNGVYFILSNIDKTVTL